MSFFGGRRQQPETPPSPSGQANQPKPAPRQPVGFETVLGTNTSLSGDLRSKANVRMDGDFEGTLEIEGNILVGETAKIIADINARNISIAGAVRGNVNGNKVQILRTGRVWGDITARAITTEEGAFIDGKITMVGHDAALTGWDAPSLPAPGDVPAPEDAAGPPILESDDYTDAVPDAETTAPEFVVETPGDTGDNDGNDNGNDDGDNASISVEESDDDSIPYADAELVEEDEDEDDDVPLL